jgi:archaellum biogenesis ATPase FlaH
MNKKNLFTGYTAIDRITGGMNGGELTLISGQPRMGKTTFALNIARNLCADFNKPVAYFSEDPSVRETFRTMKEMSKESGHANWRNKNLSMNISSFLTVDDLFDRCTRLKRENDVRTVIIDHNLWLNEPQKGRNDRVTPEWIKGLQKMAHELDRPVLIVLHSPRPDFSGLNVELMAVHMKNQNEQICGLAQNIMYVRKGTFPADPSETGTKNKDILEIAVEKKDAGWQYVMLVYHPETKLLTDFKEKI